MTAKENDYMDRFITFSEASEILGIRSYSRVSSMVRKGLLQAYELPQTERLRVRQSAIISLIQKNKKQGKEKENTNDRGI
jgi:hypothetical protein